MDTLPRRLYRRRDGRMIAGVAAGLADYFDIDPTLVRLLFVLAALINGVGLIVYIAMSFIVPEQATATDAAPQGGDPPMTESERVAPTQPIEYDATTASESHWQRREQRHTWAGLILIALGLLFLAHNVGLLWWWNWRVFWPMVLIGIGTLLLTRHLKR